MGLKSQNSCLKSRENFYFFEKSSECNETDEIKRRLAELLGIRKGSIEIPIPKPAPKKDLNLR